MSAKDLFGVILRSIGIVCVLWGLDSLIKAPFTFSSSSFGVAGSSFPETLDYAGGSVIHLNGLLVGWNVLKIAGGATLLALGAQIAGRFYPDKP